MIHEIKVLLFNRKFDRFLCYYYNFQSRNHKLMNLTTKLNCINISNRIFLWLGILQTVYAIVYSE